MSAFQAVLQPWDRNFSCCRGPWPHSPVYNKRRVHYGPPAPQLTKDERRAGHRQVEEASLAAIAGSRDNSSDFGKEVCTVYTPLTPLCPEIRHLRPDPTRSNRLEDSHEVVTTSDLQPYPPTGFGGSHYDFPRSSTSSAAIDRSLPQQGHAPLAGGHQL